MNMFNFFKISIQRLIILFKEKHFGSYWLYLTDPYM